jgi:hypothetical protein
MTPDGVLSEEQKQIRFRKLLQKKRKNASSSESSSTAPLTHEFKQEPVFDASDFSDTYPSSGNALVKYEPCESKKVKLEPDCFRKIKYFTSKQKQVNTPTSFGTTDDSYEVNILGEIRQNLENLCDEIHRTFLQARLKCQTTNSLLENLSPFQQGVNFTNILHPAFCTNVKRVAFL